MVEQVILSQRYRPLAEIGAGKMALVYRGEDTWRSMPVAIKVLRQAYAENENFLARFHRQAQAAARLVHPNIVTIYEVGQDGDFHYLVMELVEGPTLKELILEGAPFSVSQALGIAIQICAAVGYAHRAGLVHGNIKPQNVFVSPGGRVKVADFGLTSAISATPVVEGEIIWGTPHYFSPEQVAGHMVGPASDVYSIGVLIYEMLTGRPPFAAGTDFGVALKHLRDEPIPLRQLNPNVPLQVEQIVRKVLAKEPAARYRTADQLGRILDSYRRLGEALAAAQPSPLIRPQPRQVEPGLYQAAARPEPRWREPSEEEKQERDWLAIFLGIMTILAVLGLIPLGLAVYRRYALAAPQPRPTPVVTATPMLDQVRVPNLVGLSQEDAGRLAEAVGLQLAVVGEKHDPSIPALNIIAQTPLAGQMVRRGEIIGVIISQGPNFVSVPAVEGLPITAVETGLVEMGLRISRQGVWSREAEGTILSQDPPAGSIVSEGSVVTLIVSSGPRLVLDVNLDNKVVLMACDLENDSLKPGETLRLTLYWRALRLMQEDYTVFVHVARTDGTILTQRDTQPCDGAHPTSSWVPGELVRDPYELTIPDDALPDIYWLKVGMYSQATMQRLPVVESSQAVVEQDSILVKELRVVPGQ